SRSESVAVLMGIVARMRSTKCQRRDRPFCGSRRVLQVRYPDAPKVHSCSAGGTGSREGREGREEIRGVVDVAALRPRRKETMLVSAPPAYRSAGIAAGSPPSPDARRNTLPPPPPLAPLGVLCVFLFPRRGTGSREGRKG